MNANRKGKPLIVTGWVAVRDPAFGCEFFDFETLSVSLAEAELKTAKRDKTRRASSPVVRIVQVEIRECVTVKKLTFDYGELIERDLEEYH